MATGIDGDNDDDDDDDAAVDDFDGFCLSPFGLLLLLPPLLAPPAPLAPAFDAGVVLADGREVGRQTAPLSTPHPPTELLPRIPGRELFSPATIDSRAGPCPFADRWKPPTLPLTPLLPPVLPLIPLPPLALPLLTPAPLLLPPPLPLQAPLPLIAGIHTPPTVPPPPPPPPISPPSPSSSSSYIINSS